MKKRVFYACFCVVMAFALNACSDTCKTCASNTYDGNGDLVSEGEGNEYCGAELLVVEATPDFPLGDEVTKMECY